MKNTYSYDQIANKTIYRRNLYVNQQSSNPNVKSINVITKQKESRQSQKNDKYREKSRMDGHFNIVVIKYTTIFNWLFIPIWNQI